MAISQAVLLLISFVFRRFLQSFYTLRSFIDVGNSFGYGRIFVEFGRNSSEVTFPIANPLTKTLAPTIKPSTSSYTAYRVFCLSKIEVPFKKLNPKINSSTLKSINIEVFISFVSFKLKVLKYKNNNILAYLGNVSN